MSLLTRLRSAARVALRGETRSRRQNPIPSVTAEEAAEFHRFFPSTKYFVFGHARSGTTLLMRLLRLHPEVHCDYQAHFFTRRPLLKSLVDSSEVEEWLRRKSNRWNHGKDLSGIAIRAVAEYLLERDAARLGKSIVGDKSPSSTIHGQSVRDLYAVFPDARLIYIVRDGRDVAISERFRNLVEESRFLGSEDRRILVALHDTPDAFGARGRSIFTETSLRRISSGWASNVSEVANEGRRLFGRRFMAIRYEDMLANPERELGRLWMFLGVRRVPAALRKRIAAEMRSNPDEEWQQRRNEGVAHFLAKGKAGNWNTILTARDRAVFKEVAGSALLRWKFERTSDW